MDIQNIIIQKIDLPQFIKDYAHVELSRKGNGWRCKCPIHENSVNPEAMYVDDRGGYYCFACNSGGNVINFLSDYEHISYSAATERLASMLNINLKDDAEYQDQKRLEDKFNDYKKRGLAGVDNVKQYLMEKRGFTEVTIQTFELGMWDGKITIPLLDANGRTVGMAVRQFDAKPKYMNSRNNILYDKSEFLFGLDKARRLIKNTVYVVEGYMDAISGYQMGIPTVAYCSNELHRDQIRMLNNYLRRDTTVVICPDNDDAGKKRIPRVRDYFKAISPSRQVRVILMPDGYKDMNDLLLAGIDAQTLPTEHIDKYVARLIIGACKTIEEEYQRAEEYLKTVKSEMIRLDIIKYLAERWNKDVEDLKKYFNTVGEDSNDILSEASDITGCINDLRKIYSIGGYKTHFQQIDNCIRKIEKKQVVIIGGYSGTGKTSMGVEYMLRAICQDNLRVAFFSLEMPKGKLIERCVAKLIGCSMPEVEGYIASNDTAVQKVIAKLQNRLIVFDGNDYSMEDIQKRIELVNTKNVLGGPIDMVFVDYFGYMKGVSEFQGACAAATKMKAIAKENDLIFVMLSQLNRGGNPYGEPNMQQLKLTGDLEASADIIMLIWQPGKDPNLSLEERDSLENVLRIKIDKARDGMYGNPVSEYYYNKSTSRLEEKYLE
ncbi:toprim domain-containing protein [Megasphaera elsdenii]|uniref:DnaB-like helicase C-terminal domain-containing protein n=1 Tax=Megasphaera elsdenii TaxID=907 RepID=UPI00195B69CD|nr:DnaB-like helicase C-terminal domain-containing protein [Megasphaera elsdenii]MBM6701122.1 toprim domain-containing protein [Megasphaera elsdenii]